MNASFPPQSERIRAYLDDQLDEDELERFELELFSDPQLLDAVESERLMRQGLRDLDADLRERMQRLGAPGNNAAAAPRRPALPLLPMAAALLLGLIPAGLLWLRGNPAASVGNVHQAQLGQLRGTAVRLQVPPQADNLLLLIPQLAREGVDAYRVEIQGPGALRLERDKLVPGLDGQLSFSVPAAQLQAGDYRGRLIARRKDGGSETVGELNFQLEKPAAAR